MLNIRYDKQGDVLEIRFSEKAIADSEYIEESGLVVDYDEGGKIVAVELISFSKRVEKEQAVEAMAI